MVVKEKKRVKKEVDPSKAPRNILFKDAFLFKVLFTVKRRRKSKNKLRRNTKSKYMVISSPQLSYKKKDEKFVVL